MQVNNCYLIFKTDFENRNWLDWIKSHITAAPPPYRFKGSVQFDQQGLTFGGFDYYEKEETTFSISKDVFIQLYYGFDKTFHRGQTRNFGIGRAPIRFTYEDPDDQNKIDLYLIAAFNGMVSENQQLFEELKLWLS